MKKTEVEIQNAQVHYELATNLLCVSELIKNRSLVKFNKDRCRIYNAKQVLGAKAFLREDVYKVDICEKHMLQHRQQVRLGIGG